MTKTDLPVFIVTNSNSGGGAERSMNLLCRELDGLGMNIHLVNINDSKKDLMAPNVVTHQLGRKRQAGFFSTLKSLIGFQLIVWRYRPRKIVLNCEISELLGAFILRRRGLIVVQHTPNAWNGRRSLGQIVRSILRIKAATWVALRGKDVVWPFKFRSTYDVPNLIHLPEKKSLHSYSTISRLVFIGRLHSEKRADWVLEIADLLELPALLIGDGDEYSRLSTLCDDKHSSIKLVGHVPNPWALVKAGDLLLVTSDYEGDGLVVLETLSAGIPFLLRDIPDLRRFGFHSDNYCKSVEEFAARVKEYRENYTGLIPDRDTKDALLSERNPHLIASKWTLILDA